MKRFLQKHLYLIYTLLTIIFLTFVFLEGLSLWDNFSFFPGLMFFSLLFIIAGVWVIAVTPPVRDCIEMAVISKEDKRSSSISIKAVVKIIKKIAAGVQGLKIKNVQILPSEDGLIVDIDAAVKNNMVEDVYSALTVNLENVLTSAVGAKVSEINLKIVKAVFSSDVLTKGARSAKSKPAIDTANSFSSDKPAETENAPDSVGKIAGRGESGYTSENYGGERNEPGEASTADADASAPEESAVPYFNEKNMEFPPETEKYGRESAAPSGTAVSAEDGAGVNGEVTVTEEKNRPAKQTSVKKNTVKTAVKKPAASKNKKK